VNFQKANLSFGAVFAEAGRGLAARPLGNLVVQLGLATEDLNRRWVSGQHRSGSYKLAAANPPSGAAVDGERK
jgi:hypothetical protein